MSDDAKYYYVNKFDLELAINEAVHKVFYDEVVEILPKLIWNMFNEKNFKQYILKRFPDHDWSTLKAKQDKSSRVTKAYSLEMYGFIKALGHRILRHSYKFIQASQGDREWSDDSDISDTEKTPLLTIVSSSIAADQSKSVVTPQAPEEEMDIFFTKEDQPAPQLHITKADQPKTDKETPPHQSSTPEKGKTLGGKDKQLNIYGEDEVNYIVTGFLPSPKSTTIRDILINDIPAKWSNFDILQHLSSWGRVISIQVKRQKKYKTVRCIFEMNELFMKYDTNKSWMALLNALPVQWFPAFWSLKERKERERYQVVIEHPPEDMNTTTLALKENINFLIQRDICMFKEVKFPDGSRKIIGYLSTWDNMKDCIDKPMVWNGAQLKWSHHLGPSNNKSAYNTKNKIKPSKRSNTNNSQNLSHKSNTVGTGSNRISIGNRKDFKQAKKTEDEAHKISKRSSDLTKKNAPEKSRISKKKLAADIATIMETLKSLVRQ
ncbi:hypothetical protein RclHR1_16360002 [Rhizophagus clarus]|uniref:Uncharacterized protein n=1 Tax=Rhizophagus clarus TaxID=94130 RepID=A0A2Z6QLR2_9GLOM|nr:hypothetical protein RclHR1_16360002 [Rhizophagus clarus]GET01934.1 hypothetical protein GLOIN_2v1765605 [Rhizophagus clarus]